MKIMTTSKTVGIVLGAGLLLTAATHSNAQNPVRFKVDMSNTAFDSGTQTVEVRGDTLGWGPGVTLTNDPATPGIWENVYNYPDPAGGEHQYKFWFGAPDNWESPASTCGENRTFTLASGGQTLPQVYFNDAPPVLPDNQIVFQVDMTAQVLTGGFTNEGGRVAVSGGFTGWGDGWEMTNNPALSGNASNIWVLTNNVPGVVGACQGYKFRAGRADDLPGVGWESDPNRTFQITGGDQVLPLVYYNRASVCDLVQLDTPVTFTVQIPNGTPYGLLGDPNSTPPTSGTFAPPGDKVYINGDFQNWKPSGPNYGDWADPIGIADNPFTVTPQGMALELTNVPATDKYSVTLTIPGGKTVKTTYKYTINGYDNEAGMGANHVRYIRTLSGVPFAMPLDQFGTNPAPPVVEVATSNLVIGAVSGGTIPLSWGGLQCLTLQYRSSLTGGLWTDVPATEGTSSTNWPVGTGPQYFRWQKTP